MRSREVHLIERPQGLPTPAQFRIVETEVAEPGEGQLLVQNIYMSVDPAMRPRLAGPTALNEDDRRHDRTGGEVAQPRVQGG